MNHTRIVTLPSLTELQATMLPILWGDFTLPQATGGDEVAAARAIDLASVESLAAIRAARVRREAGERLDPLPAFGVVLVVPLDEWVDVLAVYRDGAVRYYNGAPPGTSASIVDGLGPTDLTRAVLDAASAAVGPAPVQHVPSPVLELGHPTATLFCHDGERLALLDTIPGGSEVLGAGIALIGALDAMRRDAP